MTDGDQTLYWETTADAYVAIGETHVDVIVRCQTAGTVGNGYVAGQINTIVDVYDYYSGCTNLTESDGGSDRATDAEFYELMRMSMDAYSCAGSRGSYTYYAKQVSTEIADVIAAPPQPGFVKVYVLMNDGTIATEEVKHAVYEACSADTVRPLTDYVTVEDAEAVPYSIDLTYYVPSDTKVSAAEIAGAVDAAIDEYVGWQSAKLGRDINPSVLIQKLMATGVKRVELRSPTYTALHDGSGTDTPQVASVGAIEVVNGGYEDE